MLDTRGLDKAALAVLGIIPAPEQRHHLRERGGDEPHVFDNGECLSCADDQPDGPMDEDTQALLTAISELIDEEPVVRAWDPGKHPRGPGGRFRSTVDRLKEAITSHLDGKGGDGHPFDDFSREQLRRVAKARGIELKRGEDRDSIAQKLLEHLAENTGRPQVDLAPEKTGKAKRAPGKPAAAKPAPQRRSRKAPSKAEIKSAKEHVPAVVKSVAWANRDQVGRELERQAELTPRSLQRLHAVRLPTQDSAEGLEWRLSRAHSTSAYYTSVGSSPANYGKVAEDSEQRPEIWLSPHWHGDQGFGPLSSAHRSAVEAGWHPAHGGELPISATVAHEYGHHVGQVFVGEMNLDGTASVTPEMADRFLTPLNEALGADRFGLGYNPDGPWDTRRPDGDLLAPVETYSGYDVPGSVIERWMSKNRDLIASKVSEYGAKNFHEMLAEIWSEYSTMGDAARPHIKVIGDLMREIAEEARA